MLPLVRSPISASAIDFVNPAPISLVIHAHPLLESLNRALYAAAIDGLTMSGETPPATASLTDGDDPTAEDLQGITNLVFVYPTWWGGLPAVLLDWVERRLGPWIDATPDSPSPIAKVETLTVITTHGSPQLLNRITGEPGRRLFKRSIVPIASPNCSWHWLGYYGIDADNAESRGAFLAGIPGRLRGITNR